MMIGTAVGAGVTYVGIPAAVVTIGFTPAGIAAGSYAATMMSGAAVASGGGIAAGSTVAMLQSIGVTGVGATATAAASATAGFITGLLC